MLRAIVQHKAVRPATKQNCYYVIIIFLGKYNSDGV